MMLLLQLLWITNLRFKKIRRVSFKTLTKHFSIFKI